MVSAKQTQIVPPEPCCTLDISGSEQTQTDYVAVGGSIVYDLGVGGAGGDSSFDGAAGLSGFLD